MGKFWYPTHWEDIANEAFAQPTDLDHTDHGFAQPFVAAQEDRDRYLEDYLNNLAPGTGKRYATVVVAAADSLHHAAADADYVCTGTNDHTTINSAIASMTRGTLLLLDGTFNLAGGLVGGPGIFLEGMGMSARATGANSAFGTRLACAATMSNVSIVQNFDEVSHLHIESPTSSATNVILLDSDFFCHHVSAFVALAATGSGSSIVYQAIEADHLYVLGGGGWTGAQLSASASNPRRLTGSYITGCDVGVLLGGTYNEVVHNRVSGNVLGISVPSGANNNAVLNNMVDANGNATHDQILVGGNTNNIQGNTVRKDTASPRYGISVLAGATDNLVTNNDLKTSGVTASFNDAGTGTITTAGNRL